MLLLKCCDTSHYPRTSSNSPRTLCSSIGKPRTVPRPLCSSVGTPHTVPRPFVLVLGHFVLSQDYLLKSWETSHCPKTSLFECWDTSHCPKTSHSSVGTLNTVPRPFVLVLGHFVLSQDYLLKSRETSHCPKTSLFECWDTSHCPKTSHSSVGTLHTVPRPFVLVLGHFALSQDLPLKCWDTSHCPKTTCSKVETLRTVPRPLTQVLEHFALSKVLFVLVLVCLTLT